MKIISNCFIISVFSFSLFAGDEKADSLLHALNTAKDDSAKVNLYLSLSKEFIDNDSLKSISYCREALVLSEKITCNRCICKVYHSIGAFYDRYNIYDSALVFFINEKECWEKYGEITESTSALNSLGNVYKTRGEYENASEIFLLSLKIEEQAGDSHGIAVCYNNIGNVYQRQRIYDKALNYLQKSLTLFEHLGNTEYCAKIVNNIGIVLWYKGELRQALEYYNRTVDMWKKLNREDMLSAVYNNIGIVYYYLYEKDKALDYFLKSLEIRLKANNKQDISAGYGNIAELYMETGNYEKALDFAHKSLSIAKDIGTKEEVKFAYHTLAMTYGKMNNYKKAFDYLKLFSDTKDSLVNEQTTKQISEMEAKYENEKKERQIEVQGLKLHHQELELNKKQIAIYAVSGGLLLVLVLAFVIYRGYKQKKESNRELLSKNNIITEQKNEIEKQKDQIFNKNQDLTDSITYAQRIQQAILTSESYLNELFLPSSDETVSHFILYKPKDIVAGDFYWAYKTPQDTAIWIAADCTGHGVSGALMSMIGNSLLNEIVVENKVYEPNEILNQLRNGIIKSLGQSGSEDKYRDGMDAAVCCWSKMNNMLCFSGANNSLWIVRACAAQNSGFIEIPADHQPVGYFMENMQPFTVKEIELQPGDTLYTFTDGYCDQFGGPKGKKFRYKPFKELLLSIKDKSMTVQKELIDKAITNWQGKHEQVDDICIIGVRV